MTYLPEDIDLIRQSPFFDGSWYAARHPDVTMLGMDPAEHYLWLGARLGRSPSRHFDGDAYLSLNDDVAERGINPLLHYLKWGRNEARSYLAVGGDESPSGQQEDLPPRMAATSAVALFEDPEPQNCWYFDPGPKRSPFLAWQHYNGPSSFRSESIRSALDVIEEPLRFSIIVPVYNPPLEVLEDCIRSVVEQTHGNWELILVDDASTDKAVLPLLTAWARRDARITVHARQENGHISVATDDGVRLASGDFLVFLDNDDMLARDALALITLYVQNEPTTDLVYSDDGRFNDGKETLATANFKPGWSPELLLSFCYISHVKAVRRQLYWNVGGSRRGFEGSQDHDLLLRAGERARHVGHIPQILYHRRVLPGSTAASGHAKPYSFEAGRRAAEEAFHRRNVPCDVQQPAWAFERGYGIYVPVMPDTGPRVTVIVPTRNNWQSLDRLLRSLKKTTYRDYDLLIVDNMSDDPQTVAYLEKAGVSVVRIPNPGDKFNFAAINNEAVKQVDSEFILFLNDDIEVLDPRWLSQMVGWGRLPGVGIVGARLLFGDGRVQHGGVATSLPHHVGRTAFRGLARRDFGYLFFARVSHNCSAVTAACMLTPRALFLEMGGFDQQVFGVAYNDIDYCIRVRDSGRRIVYCGETELAHHESTSRGKTDALSEIAAYRRLHGADPDPYYSPHLSKENNRFEIKPSVVPPVRSHRPIRLLAATHNLRIEGAPNSAFELLSGISRDNRFEVTVISPSDGPLRAAYLDAGIDVRVLDRELSINRHLRNVGDYEGLHGKLNQAVGLDRYDVVYANTAELFWVIDAAHSSGVPSVWNIRESQSWKCYYDRYPAEIGTRALAAYAYPYRAVFVAQATRKRWSSLETMHNFHVIHNGIDIDRLRPPGSAGNPADARRRLGIPEDAVVILAVGTVAARKGQHDLLEAIGRMPKETTDKLFVCIVGARPSAYLDFLRNLLDALPGHVRDRIRLVNETGNTGDFWSAADIFVCNSRLESYPRVILEAMAHELPIVTTPSFGVREQVQEGANAVFYQPGDSGTLCAELCRLVEDRAGREAMSKSSLPALACLASYQQMLNEYKDILHAAAFSSVPGAALPALGS